MKIADKIGDVAKIGLDVASNLDIPGTGVAKNIVSKLDKCTDTVRSKRQQLIDKKNGIKDKMLEQLRSKLNMEYGYNDNVVNNNDQVPLLNKL